jgi:hypothetical protein
MDAAKALEGIRLAIRQTVASANFWDILVIVKIALQFKLRQ